MLVARHFLGAGLLDPLRQVLVGGTSGSEGDGLLDLEVEATTEVGGDDLLEVAEGFVVAVDVPGALREFEEAGNVRVDGVATLEVGCASEESARLLLVVEDDELLFELLDEGSPVGEARGAVVVLGVLHRLGSETLDGVATTEVGADRPDLLLVVLPVRLHRPDVDLRGV